MTVNDALRNARKTLKHLETPDLDAEVLLAYVTGQPREFILTHPEKTLTDTQVRTCNDLVARRTKHEPVAYLTKHKEFYGRRFYVDKRVHIPRPATEDLIDTVKRHYDSSFDGVAADIGTGSGCIAITLALEFPRMTLVATDISGDALSVARQNARDNNVSDRITFRIGSLGESITAPIDVIAANLPYGWRDGWSRDPEIKFQPEISYISGVDSPSGILGAGSGGLDALRGLIKQLPDILAKNGRAFLEFDPRQAEQIKKIAAEHGYQTEMTKDAAGFERILHLTA